MNLGSCRYKVNVQKQLYSYLPAQMGGKLNKTSTIASKATKHFGVNLTKKYGKELYYEWHQQNPAERH